MVNVIDKSWVNLNLNLKCDSMTMSQSHTRGNTVIQVGVAGCKLSTKANSLFVAMVILINTSLDRSTHADT